MKKKNGTTTDSSIDIGSEPEGKQNGTAPLQDNSVSEINTQKSCKEILDAMTPEQRVKLALITLQERILLREIKLRNHLMSENYEGALKTLSERTLPLHLKETQEEILRNSNNNK